MWPGSKLPSELMLNSREEPSGPHRHVAAPTQAAWPATGFLDALTAALGSHASLEDGLHAAMRLLVNGLGDLAILDVVDEQGGLRRAAWAASDDSRKNALAELQKRYPPDASLSTVVERVLAHAEPVVQTDTPEEHLRKVARDEDHLALIRRLKLRSSVAVPVRGRREVLGLLRVSSGQPERFGPLDVAQLLEAGRAIGLAVEAARLAEAEARARAHAASAELRLHLLETASTALASGRELSRTLNDVARLAVPGMADWMAIDLVTASRGADRLVRSAVAHADPAVEEAARDATALLAPRIDDAVGEAAVIRHGTPVLVPVITDEMLGLYARDEEQLALIRKIMPRSTVLAPIRTDGAAFGCVSLTRGEGRPPFDDEDLALAIDLGQRLGWAVENARLQENARNMAAERDELMSIVGHELKTPLTALRLGLDLLGRQLGKLSPSAGEQIGRMKRQVVRVAELVDQLVEDARVGTGRLDLDRQTFDASDIVAEVVRRLEPVAAEAGCLVHLVAAGPALLWADKRRIEQVVTNLVANACKYAPGCPIDVVVVLDDDCVRIVVEDAGPGIEPEVLPHVFARFRRGRHAGSTGLGLGLWLAKVVVEAHGGTVAAENKRGGGARFVVRLPRRLDPPTA